MKLGSFDKLVIAIMLAIVVVGVTFVIEFNRRTAELERRADETIRSAEAYLQFIKETERREREQEESLNEKTEKAEQEKPAAKPTEKEQPKASTRANPWTVAVVSQTLWMEARGEGRKGIEAVASVIVNRASRNGTNAARECLRRKQFSCWDGKSVDASVKHKGQAWNDCVAVAELVAKGQFKPTTASTHYYAPKLCKPVWSAGMKNRKRIGNHVFGETK